MKVQIISLPNNQFCLIDPSDDWREGYAVDLKKKEIIYYNGDYGQTRPTEIKKLVAEPHEIGWVSISDSAGNIATANFKDCRSMVMDTITKHNGVCELEEKKIQGKHVITLPL